MTLLAGFLDVLLRGISLIAFATAVGGVAYVLWALRPLQEWTAHLAGFVQRALRLITIAAFTLAGVQALVVFVLHPWTLADEAGRWPLAALLHTDYARTGLITIALALCLGALGRTLMLRPRSVPLWTGAVALVLALLVNSAWLAHGVSRLTHREVLMAVTVLHVAGAAVWIGGLIHLAGFWQLRRREAHAGGYGPVVLARFSDLAIASVALLVLPGLYLAWVYVGDLDALIGTGYGVMVLTKVVLLLATLTLGGINLLLVKSWRRSWPDPGPARRIPALVEAEVGLGVTILLAAASLTSLPPSIDIGADRASPAEVMARFVPKLPRLASPPVQDLLASAGRIDDTLAERQPAEYAWSEYNHHMAGMFVFAMGLCALMERRRAARWARHWPLIFLGLAAFLFIRNDPRAWPLGPAGFWESMALPDVLQHRLVVGVVVALALFEWQVRTGRLQNPRWRLAFPLLCAAGGALILTHSHAMFNLKSEFLAEVSHAPLGVFAVLMGWGRWLELRLPEEDRRIPAWVWPVAFTLIGLTLLLYREI